MKQGFPTLGLYSDPHTISKAKSSNSLTASNPGSLGIYLIAKRASPLTMASQKNSATGLSNPSWAFLSVKLRPRLFR